MVKPKSKFVLAFIIASCLLNLLAFTILTAFVKAVYWSQGTDYDKTKVAMDLINIKLNSFPILAHWSFGCAVGVIIMTIWIIADDR